MLKFKKYYIIKFGDSMNNKAPNHVGIIMDGNGRWAEKRGLIRSLGHEAGSNNLISLATHIYECGVKYLSIYAFSADNFKRDAKEVNFLMNLFTKIFRDEFSHLMNLGVKVVFSGREEGLPKKVIDSMHYITEKSKDNQNGVLNVCINYSSQIEIIDAYSKLKEGNADINKLERKDLLHYMYQDLPYLDLVIRTSGEQRISDFMLYQSSYAEYYFPKTLFPDFDAKEFDLAIEIYNSRDRRFGGIKNEKKSN